MSKRKKERSEEEEIEEVKIVESRATRASRRISAVEETTPPKSNVSRKTKKVAVLDVSKEAGAEKEEDDNLAFTQIATQDDIMKQKEDRDLSKGLNKKQTELSQSLSDETKSKYVSRILKYILFEISCKRSGPVTLASIKKHCFDEGATDVSNLLRVTLPIVQKELRNVFGYDIISVNKETKGSAAGPYILVNLLDSAAIKDANENDEAKDRGVLLLILSLIFLNKNIMKEKDLKKALADFGLNFDVKDSVAQVLITKFIKQQYLKTEKDDDNLEDSDKVPLCYLSGPRSKLELGEEDLLNFISKVMKKKLTDEQRKKLLSDD